MADPHPPAESLAVTNAPAGCWYREWEFYAVCLLVIGLYFLRLTLLPACGEETRVARMAVQMMETGDWIVPRQQGSPFPERPPLGAWSMATVGLLRGEVDLVAIRLPSVIALLLTATLIYIYARSFLSSLGALASAVAYITAGQVLQIGRHGESEPLFALFVGASLLVWHYGVMHRWHPALSWMAGYSLAALGALMKGPQAPIYFCAAVGMYLIVKRDWRRLFGWEHLLGIAAFAGILALWLVPFYLEMGAAATADIWTILARKRFGTGGIVKHLVSYPFETLACLLPWSPLALHLLSKKFRQSLSDIQPQLVFLITALAVTYPSVLFAAGARGRYYMPLYPLAAVLLGIIIERSILAPQGTWARAGWNRFLMVFAVLSAVAGIGIFGISAYDQFAAAKVLTQVAQPLIWAACYLLLAAAATFVFLWARKETHRASVAICTVAAFLGLSYSGLVLSAKAKSANDIQPAVAELREKLPPEIDLVSLGPIAHQFAYAYKTPIKELPWPSGETSLDPKVTYFCYHISELDKPGLKHNGRGMTFEEVPIELPFAWEEVARVNYGREKDDERSQVIVGRVLSHTAQKPDRKSAH